MRNIINRYAEWLNRNDRRGCEKLQKGIYKREWSVQHELKLYVLECIAFAGLVVSAVAVFLYTWRIGDNNEWLAAPIIICALVYFGVVLWMDRKYRNR